MTFRRLKNKIRYYWRRFNRDILHRCPDCSNSLYVTQCGNYHCSWCGRMK